MHGGEEIFCVGSADNAQETAFNESLNSTRHVLPEEVGLQRMCNLYTGTQSEKHCRKAFRFL